MTSITRGQFASSASIALGGVAGQGLSAGSGQTDANNYEAAVART